MQGIRNGKIILEDSIVEDNIILYDRRIRGIVECAGSAVVSKWIDAAGCYVAPGFIDIHIHGAGGADIMDPHPGAVAAVSRAVCAGGTTAFLPTTMTMLLPVIHRALDSIREALAGPPAGARILGAHLEGPFINPAYKGAQDEAHILPPAVEPIRGYLDLIKVITYAPELDPELAFTREIRQRGDVVLSIGHSAASYEEALAAFAAGVSSATHTFNAMTGLHHRRPGVAGAVLLSGLCCELIADPALVHPAAFRLLRELKGPAELILVTDAMQAAGLGDGDYCLGGQAVTVSAGAARLNDGTLAGSVLKMNEAVSNYRRHTGCPLPEAVRAASLNPAALLGWSERKGSLKPGKDADFVLLNPDLSVAATIVEGRLTYTGPSD